MTAPHSSKTSNSPNVLSNVKKKHLRSIGHNLQPIVTVAEKGLSENVRSEIERALKDHELIKVKMALTDREEKKRLSAEIQTTFNATIVQSIGHILLLYRRASKQNSKLSNLVRHNT